MSEDIHQEESPQPEEISPVEDLDNHEENTDLETTRESGELEEPVLLERTTLGKVFYSREENRLRTGWRLLIQSIMLVTFILSIEFILDYFLFQDRTLTGNTSQFVSQIIMLLGVTGSVFVARRLWDNRSFTSLGLREDRKPLNHLGLGILIAALVMGFIFLVQWAFDLLTFEGFAWKIQDAGLLVGSLLVYLIFYLIVGWQEELLFRGYWLQNLEEGLNLYWVLAAFLLPTLVLLLNSLVSLAIGPVSPSVSLTIARILILLILILGLIYGAVQLEQPLTERWEWFALKENISLPWAVVLSSLVFSAAHFGNPGFNILAVIGLILSGAFLAYSYIATRSLWLPIGIHIGWNFFEGCVFGFPVSGTNPPQLILHSSEGPALWTGGAFGPEAGLVLIPGLALGVFLVWAFASSPGTIEEETSPEE